MKRRDFIHTSMCGAGLLKLTSAGSSDQRNATVASAVINAGVSGNNTVDVLESVQHDCLSHKPTLTILKVGTNDMNSRKYIPLPQYEINFRKIVGLILDAKSQLVLMNLLPVYEPYLFTRHKPEFYGDEGHSGRLREMNACIKKVAHERGLALIDLYHLFSKAGNVGLDKSSWLRNEANSNTTDGLHPTPEGYRAIGISVYQHIMFHKLNTEKIVCLGDSITFGDGSPDGDNYPAWLKKLLN